MSRERYSSPCTVSAHSLRRQEEQQGNCIALYAYHCISVACSELGTGLDGSAAGQTRYKLVECGEWRWGRIIRIGRLLYDFVCRGE